MNIAFDVLLIMLSIMILKKGCDKQRVVIKAIGWVSTHSRFRPVWDNIIKSDLEEKKACKSFKLGLSGLEFSC